MCAMKLAVGQTSNKLRILGPYPSGFLSHFQAVKYKFYQYLANAGLIIELCLVIGQAA